MMNSNEHTAHEARPVSISRGEKVVAGRNVSSAIARIQADRNDAKAWSDLESALQEFIAVRIREYAPEGIISGFDHESIYTEIYDMALRMISENQCKGITEDLRERIELLCKDETGIFAEMPQSAAFHMTASHTSAQDVVIAQEAPLALERVLNKLLPKDREVLQHRFGLNENSELSVEEVARKMGVCENRIRQRQRRAMSTLRRPNQLRRLNKI